MRLSTKRKERSKESFKKISFLDEDVSHEIVKGKSSENGSTVRKLLLEAMNKTKEIAGKGKKSNTKSKPLAPSTSVGSCSYDTSVDKNDSFESDRASETRRTLDIQINDEWSSSSYKINEYGTVEKSYKSCSSVISIETKKIEIQKVSLADIAAEWSSCGEVMSYKKKVKN